MALCNIIKWAIDNCPYEIRFILDFSKLEIIPVGATIGRLLNCN